jgi:hypothetical protein
MPGDLLGIRDVIMLSNVLYIWTLERGRVMLHAHNALLRKTQSVSQLY